MGEGGRVDSTGSYFINRSAAGLYTAKLTAAPMEKAAVFFFLRPFFSFVMCVGVCVCLKNVCRSAHCGEGA
jgi:hypothetical protein